MNKQVIAAVLGGLVIGGAAFIPMEVAALQSDSPAGGNSQVQDPAQDKQSGADSTGSVDESVDNSLDGTAGTAGTDGTAPSPIKGPSFSSGDDDDDDDEGDDGDHEEREDHEDEEDDD